MNQFELDRLIMNALNEDIGLGDITTESCVPEGRRCSGSFVAKEAGVVCGLSVAGHVFSLLDGGIAFSALVEDGSSVSRGDAIAAIHGPARAILSGERVALNLLQRLSGIATRTAQAVREVAGTKAKIVDTRKTTPGLRALEKYAVRCGGGGNHRFGLFDGVLIKDNHIVAAGGIAAAVGTVRAAAPHTLKIEVEVTGMAELSEALAVGADIIMLDNMTVEEMAAAVRAVDGRALIEASGNMGERSLGDVAKTGVDLISIGALTHTVKAMDISLRFTD